MSATEADNPERRRSPKGAWCRQLCTAALLLSVLKSQCQCSTDWKRSPLSSLCSFLLLFYTSTCIDLYINACMCVWFDHQLHRNILFFSLIFNSNLNSKFYSYLRQWCTHSYKIHPLVSGSKLESTIIEKSETDFLICQFIYFLLLKAIILVKKFFNNKKSFSSLYYNCFFLSVFPVCLYSILKIVEIMMCNVILLFVLITLHAVNICPCCYLVSCQCKPSQCPWRDVSTVWKLATLVGAKFVSLLNPTVYRHRKCKCCRFQSI